MRFLISENRINPIAWEVSKVEDTLPLGIISITLKQDLFNPATDNKELMIADYYSSEITPTKKKVKSKIEYSGNPALKVAGSYKIFSIKNYHPDRKYTWNVQGLRPDDYELVVEEDKAKLKISKNYTLIGTVFGLELYADDEPIDFLKCEVVTL